MRFNLVLKSVWLLKYKCQDSFFFFFLNTDAAMILIFSAFLLFF